MFLLRFLFIVFIFIFIENVFAEEIKVQNDRSINKIEIKKTYKISYDLKKLQEIIINNKEAKVDYGIIRIVDSDLNITKDIKTIEQKIIVGDYTLSPSND
jgi:hypothetical protein